MGIILFINYANPGKNTLQCKSSEMILKLNSWYQILELDMLEVDVLLVFWLGPLYLNCNNFLIALSLKEFAGEDTSDLFLEERETALRQAQEEKHKLQMSVPGILNPHEIPEEMCD